MNYFFIFIDSLLCDFVDVRNSVYIRFEILNILFFFMR